MYLPTYEHSIVDDRVIEELLGAKNVVADSWARAHDVIAGIVADVCRLYRSSIGATGVANGLGLAKPLVMWRQLRPSRLGWQTRIT